jgi:hypothetical protein
VSQCHSEPLGEESLAFNNLFLLDSSRSLPSSIAKGSE